MYVCIVYVCMSACRYDLYALPEPEGLRGLTEGAGKKIKSVTRLVGNVLKNDQIKNAAEKYIQVVTLSLCVCVCARARALLWRKLWRRAVCRGESWEAKPEPCASRRIDMVG